MITRENSKIRSSKASDTGIRDRIYNVYGYFILNGGLKKLARNKNIKKKEQSVLENKPNRTSRNEIIIKRKS